MRVASASDVAAEALASLSVGAADTAEQADRRRRLTKGPLEFRERPRRPAEGEEMTQSSLN
jgi:hypothetical protein